MDHGVHMKTPVTVPKPKIGSILKKSLPTLQPLPILYQRIIQQL